MQTKPKSNSVITHAVNDAGDVITFNVLGVGSFDLNMGLLSGPVLARAAVHGMIQRVSDAAAISRDPKTGKSATPDEKYAAMLELVEYYQSGATDWSRVGQGGPRGGLLFRALCRMFDGQKTAADVRAFLDGISRAEQAALRADAKVAAIIRDIEAEDVTASKVDTGALLAQLES